MMATSPGHVGSSRLRYDPTTAEHLQQAGANTNTNI